MLTKLTTALENQALRLEQVVLGAVLHKNDLLDRMELPEEAFAEPLHREIYRTMLANHISGRGNTKATLGVKFATEAPITEKCTVPEYIRRLELAGFEWVQGADLELKELAGRRAIKAIAEHLLFHAEDRETEMRDVAGEAISLLNDVVSASKGKSSIATFSQTIRESVEELRSPRPAQRITTGIASLDNATGGWQRGQFAILAGRPSMGKSMIALSALLRTARAGHGVMLFSLEMGHHEIACRAMSDLSWERDRRIPYSLALGGSISDNQRERLERAAAMYETIPLIVDEQRGLTVSEIAARARKQKKAFEDDGGSLDLVVVDHLGLIKPSGRYAGNKVQETGEISDGLATIAKELDCCVLALQQLNRGVEGRENKRPGLSDLRNSGDLEQDAHVVMFAYRESYYLERTSFDPGTQQEIERSARLDIVRNQAEILIAKNRNGPTETVHVYCDPACNAIRDLAKRAIE